MKKIEEAIIYATVMHQGKVRKLGSIPYILHPLEVALVILSNIFYPLTIMIDADGFYQATGASSLEDIYLAVASLISTVVIIRSESPRSQKIAALTFIFLSVVNYATMGGEFGIASQYGMVLMSLIIIFCIIFNDKSSKLASTQTELNMATDIQASMLPSIFPAFPAREEFDLYASMILPRKLAATSMISS